MLSYSQKAGPLAPQVRIGTPVALANPRDELIRAVRMGLEAPPRWLPPQLLYDDVGSRLYEEITRLPEYYPFGTEEEILSAAAGEIAEIGRPEALIEFGSGSASKTRILLDAVVERESLRGYGAIEVSEAALRDSFDRLATEYPDIAFEGALADFNEHLPIPFDGARRLLLFLGSTIGNLDEAAAVRFLGRVAEAMSPADTFLVGFDLVKDVDVIEAAYNDGAGVTAEFNLNVLARLNREVGSDFPLESYRHSAFFNCAESQIEMHLVAERAHRVSLGDGGFSFDIRAGESIRTEISRKFDRAQVEGMLHAAGLDLEAWYTDSKRYFAVALLRRADPTDPDRSTLRGGRQ